MNLLANEQNLIKDNYFRVWDIVKLLYDTQLPEREDDLATEWSDVGLFLGHYSFDTQLILFKEDEYLHVTPYYTYSPISNLIQRLMTEWPPKEESIRTIKMEIYGFYWLKKDIYNFKPIMDLGIIEKPYVESLLEIQQLEELSSHADDSKKEIEQLKKKLHEKEVEIVKLNSILTAKNNEYSTINNNFVLLPESTYTTPPLEALHGVINEFWVNYNPNENQPPPKQDVVANWIMANYPDVQSKGLCIYIDKICRHPIARNGGNRKINP